MSYDHHMFFQPILNLSPSFTISCFPLEYATSYSFLLIIFYNIILILKYSYIVFFLNSKNSTTFLFIFKIHCWGKSLVLLLYENFHASGFSKVMLGLVFFGYILFYGFMEIAMYLFVFLNWFCQLYYKA